MIASTMMTDFEDRQPAPPRSFGMRVELVLASGFVVFGLVAMGQMVWSLIVRLVS